MNSLQKIIKYLAVALAIFLTFNIIYGIMYGVSFIGNIFGNDETIVEEKLNELEVSNATKILEINVSSSNITFKQGTTFRAETNNKYINIKQDNNKMLITEKKNNWFFNSNNNELIIYIPNDFIFDVFLIETGAGKVNIDSLSTKQLYLNLGAGKVDINSLNVLSKAKVDGGAGDLSIIKSDIHNLDLDMGVGKLLLESKLTGNNKIDSGVGKMDLTLIGTLDDYQISLDKGIGNATINGTLMVDKNIYGTGFNKIDIDGGIGSIDIDFKSLRG